MSKEGSIDPVHHDAPSDVPQRSQEPESRGLKRTHISTAATPTIAEEEVQPCLDARSSVTGSSQEKPTTTPDVARNVLKNLGSSGLAFATSLLPIYFLIFAALAFRNNNAVLETGSQAERLLAAAKYVRSSGQVISMRLRLTDVQGPSVFPIMFATIMGQLMTVIASFMLERGITIGRLEYLLGSRSLGSAFLSLIKLRIFNTLVPLILTAWCLSPLGGQASLRAVFSQVAYTKSLMDLHYLDNNNTTPINVYASAIDSYAAAINSVFVTALGSSNASKYGPQDMYGNLHLPILESLTSEPTTDGWYDLRNETEALVHPALFGIPFIGVPYYANSSINLSTSYIFCNCSVAVESFDPYADLGYMWNISAIAVGSGLDATTMTYGRLNATGPRLRDLSVFHQRNDTTSRMIGLQSRNFGSLPALGTEALCSLSTTYIEVHARCFGGPQNCTAQSVRKAPQQPWPATATALDCIWDPYCDSGALLTESFFRQFMNAVPQSSNGDYTALEQFFLTPGVPFLFPNSTVSVGGIGDELFSQRLTQLLNTYLLACAAPYAISANFSHSTQDEGYSAGHSIANSLPSYGIQTTEGRVQRSHVVFRCHITWTIILIAISSLLIAAGISTAILDSRRKGPQVLDDFTSSLRYNPYSSVEQKNSIEDGIDIARRSRHVRVQLGDVRPHDEVGLVAVATMGDDEGQTVERLRQRRLYS
ncbi:hypothetical protein Q7P36_001482 [Cladosporium allicinum]